MVNLFAELFIYLFIYLMIVIIIVIIIFYIFILCFLQKKTGMAISLFIVNHIYLYIHCTYH